MKDITKKVVILNNFSSPYICEAIIVLRDYNQKLEGKIIDEIVTLHDFLIVLVDAHPHLVKHAVRFECRRASARDTSTFGVPQFRIDSQFAACLLYTSILFWIQWRTRDYIFMPLPVFFCVRKTIPDNRQSESLQWPSRWTAARCNSVAN